jgi:hypothetical protein
MDRERLKGNLHRLEDAGLLAGTWVRAEPGWSA